MESSSSRNKLHNSNMHHNCQWSVSPSSRLCSSTISSSSFSTQSSDWFTRSTSPTRLNLRRSVSLSPSVRFYSSSSRSISVFPHKTQQNSRTLPSNQKKHCTCSPRTHPGSFRCSLHKNTTNRSRGQSNTSSYHSSHQLNMRRSAMTNSLVRIGTVEGELVKRALASLIRPSSHQLRRRCNFQPRPSRLFVMSKAEVYIFDVQAP